MNWLIIIFMAPMFLGIVSCIEVPKTIQFDDSISYTEIDGYKFHTETYGDPKSTPVIMIHGGPGGDYEYLKSLRELSANHYVIFYDQRGTGLSPRVQKEQLTLESSLADLHSIVKHFSNGRKVKLIGHSWGGMLAIGFLSQHPNMVSQAVVVEPGMLYPLSAKAFVKKMKEFQSFSDILALLKYISIYPFVCKEDGHEGYDYVMTKLMNRSKPGAPYQCKDEAMPPNIFKRAGYEAFNNMLKPVMDNPESFTYDLTENIYEYKGDLMLISSECSAFGYSFQEKYHIPKLPHQTIHIEAKNMGHNMLTLNPEWSLKMINSFFNKLNTYNSY